MSRAVMETVYHRSSTALVTNTRIVLNDVTYSIANVTSVRSLCIKPNATWPLLLALAGVGVLIVAGLSGVIFGLMLIALGGWFLWRLEFEYVLVIGSAGGEKHAMVSSNRKDIEPVVDAITEAIVARG